MMSRLLTAALLAGAVILHPSAHAEDLEPPELTTVTGRLMINKDKGAPAGVAYFVFQRRLLEIPHEGTLDTLRAMAEEAVAVDNEGSFTLRMAPGNYLMVYEPGSDLDPVSLRQGPQSFAQARQLTPEQIRERVERIKENAQKGLPISKGRIGDAYVVENRFVRPPVTDFGEILLGDTATITVIAQDMEGKMADFPVALRLRGKNGDIYEPHPPTVSKKGTFVFHDVFPQPYQVFGLAVKPAPGQGDEATTPTVTNADLLFTGEPLEWKVKVDPNPEPVELVPPEEPAARTEGDEE